MTSFRILINCLEFWRNLIHPDSAPTKNETERCENIVKIHPTFHKHATEMFLGLKNYCEKNNYEILFVVYLVKGMVSLEQPLRLRLILAPVNLAYAIHGH